MMNGQNLFHFYTSLKHYKLILANNGISNGTAILKSIPLEIATITNCCPKFCLITGKEKSIAVAPQIPTIVNGNNRPNEGRKIIASNSRLKSTKKEIALYSGLIKEPIKILDKVYQPNPLDIASAVVIGN